MRRDIPMSQHWACHSDMQNTYSENLHHELRFPENTIYLNCSTYTFHLKKANTLIAYT